MFLAPLLFLLGEAECFGSDIYIYIYILLWWTHELHIVNGGWLVWHLDVDGHSGSLGSDLPVDIYRL